MNKRIPKSKLVKKQVKRLKRTTTLDGEKVDIIVKIRLDDQCGNGHNTFSITASVDKTGKRNDSAMITCGCCHNIVAKYFPQLKKYIKWHLCNTDEPLHYIANTIYHAGSRDCWGLKKGEVRQLKNSKTGELRWKLEEHGKIAKNIDSNTEPTLPNIKLKYVPWCRVGEGKESDLKAARSSAIWEDATLEQLLDEKLLKARHPALMAEFKKDVESLGFVY